MPTPVAHALGGIAASCLVVAGAALACRARASSSALRDAIARVGPRRGLAGLACIAMLPDLDLLFGWHRTATHSLGGALLAAAIASAVVPGPRLLVPATVAAAFGSHALLDWLGTDPSPPRGIMAWWPWTNRYYLSDAELFLRVCREYWMAACWRHNALALLRELALLVPLTGAALFAARRALGGGRRS